MSSVPWLIKYLAQELEDGGVAVEEEASAAADVEAAQPKIFWAFRDNRWTARVKTPAGEKLENSICINRRMRTPGDRLHSRSRPEAKAAAFEELRCWREAALQGLVAAEDAAADAALFCV